MRVTTTLVLAALLPVSAGGQSAEPAPPREAPPGATAPGAAAAEPRAPAASPIARELSRALLPQREWDRLLDSYASSLSEQVSRALLSRGETVPDGLQAEIRSELGDRLRYEQTVDAQAQALAGQLSADELKKAAAFYATPAGKKVVEKLPEAQAETGEDLQQRLATAVPEILQRVAPSALAPPDAAPGGGEPRKETPPAQGRRPPEQKQR
jgi:hypothetical protein